MDISVIIFMCKSNHSKIRGNLVLLYRLCNLFREETLQTATLFSKSFQTSKNASMSILMSADMFEKQLPRRLSHFSRNSENEFILYILFMSHRESDFKNRKKVCACVRACVCACVRVFLILCLFHWFE